MRILCLLLMAQTIDGPLEATDAELQRCEEEVRRAIERYERGEAHDLREEISRVLNESRGRQRTAVRQALEY